MGRAVVARGTACLRRLRTRAGAGPDAAEPDPRELRKVASVGERSEDGSRVLLVEDDAALASVVARHLVARGHQTEVAPSAPAVARVLAAGFAPTVVIVDVDLADGEAWELLGDGRLGNEAERVVTASAGVRGSRLRQLGVDWFVLKPFALSVLVEIVEGRRPPEGATRLEHTSAARARGGPR